MLKRKPVPASSTLTQAVGAIMPGSFLSREELLAQMNNDVFHNPWDSGHDNIDPISTLEQIQELVPRSAEIEQQELRWVMVDWRTFAPPTALRRAPNITSHILLDVVQSSITTAQGHVREQKRQELLSEERKLLQELEAKRAKGKGKAPHLPSTQVEDGPGVLPSGDSSISQDGTSLATTVTYDAVITRPSDELAPQPTADSVLRPENNRPHKSRESAIRRLFKRNAEKAESSADGSAREGLLQRLLDSRGDHSSKSAEQKTQDAVVRLKRRLKTVQEPQLLQECVSCLEDILPKECIAVQCHTYCKECFLRLIATACENEAQWPPKCCLNNIPFALIRKNVPSAVRKTFNERSNEWSIPIAERVYCYRADCGLFIRPEKIKTNTSTGQCDKGHWTCLNCRNERHGQGDCPMDEAMILTNQIAEDEGWRRCYRCRALVEHSAACQHMTCRCGAEFCYVCGLRWRTCQCSMTDLDNVKERANERREQRRLKEEVQSAEAEELRLILAQIEAFEQEEIRQAELLAEQQRMEAEQQRLEAQERKERELINRAKAESARVRDMGLKFKHMRQSLDGLHELQSVLLEMDHEEASSTLAFEEEQATAQFEEKHKMKCEEVADSFKAKIAAREAAFAKEFALRVKMESQVESTFYQELSDFWSDQEDGAEQIDMAMLQLQQKMDRNFRKWQSWSKQLMQELHESLEEETVKQKELMWSEKEAIRTSFETRRRGLSEKKYADRKWVEVVMLERERMINEMEVEEIEGDADLLQPDEETA